MNTHVRGRGFEELAERHLRQAGFVVVARNFRCGREEIDLVARRGTLVAFVEVKGRARRDAGHPLHAIGPRKRAAIARVARDWIREHGRPGESYRFDAVAILPCEEGWEVDHVTDAWRLG
ncbi:MAG: YraN family protein [Longimicrobiales bacterium]|nr:YraN family protein [Longimicrobiales bacterium]